MQIEEIPTTKLTCTHCFKEAIARCHDCGGLALYCAECIKKLHANVNVCPHSLFVWKVCWNLELTRRNVFLYFNRKVNVDLWHFLIILFSVHIPV